MADAMNTMKGGVRVLGWLERPAKWFAAIAGAVLALYALLKLKGWAFSFSGLRALQVP